MEVPECPPTPPVLSEGLSSPKHLESPPRSGSPEPNCPICLGPLDNKSYSDSCFHKFCFKCLLEWSKVKPECPLCKQKFKSIIHNVKSQDEYEQYTVQPSTAERERLLMVMDPWGVPPWFVRRAIRHHVNLPNTIERPTPVFRLLDILPSGRALSDYRGQRSAPQDYRAQYNSHETRRNIYLGNLWAQPLPDISGRQREFATLMYRNNNRTKIARLTQFITRDVAALTVNGEGRHTIIAERICDALRIYDMRNPAFLQHLRDLIGDNARHFVHELINFARSQFDLLSYDEHVTYGSWYPGLDDYAAEFERENRPVEISDDDIVELPLTAASSSATAVSVLPSTSGIRMSHQRSIYVPSPEPGPSGMSFLNANSPLVIYSSDDDSLPSTHEEDNDASLSDVEIVAVLKPKHERTPEIVDLLSDSDNNEPSVSLANATWDDENTTQLNTNIACCSTSTIDSNSGIFLKEETIVPQATTSTVGVVDPPSSPAAHHKSGTSSKSISGKQKHKKPHKRSKRRNVSSDDEWYGREPRHKKKRSRNYRDSESSDDDKRNRSHKQKKYRDIDRPNYRYDWTTSDESDINLEVVRKCKENWKVQQALSEDEGSSNRPRIRSIVVKRQPVQEESASSSSAFSYSYKRHSDSDSSWEPRSKHHKRATGSKDKGKGKGKKKSADK